MIFPRRQRLETRTRVALSLTVPGEDHELMNPQEAERRLAKIDEALARVREAQRRQRQRRIIALGIGNTARSSTSPPPNRR
jgi:hypothetical protein